jgi:hypothetical protein
VLEDVLLCPNCRGRLRRDGPRLECLACAATLPSLGGVQVALPDSPAVLLDWRASLFELEAATLHECDEVLATSAASPVVVPTTRARIAALRRGLEQQMREVLAIFEGATLEPRARSEPPGPFTLRHGPLFYQHHVHRDWGWDRAELLRAVEVMTSVWPDQEPLGRVLFLGVGAAGTAAELCRRMSPTLAVGIDVNPLPLLVARRLVAGERVAFHEVPTSPRGSRSPVVARTLSGERASLELVLADALAPPFADASFDTVVTEWFLDQCVPDLGAYVPTLARLLRVGGRVWNHGPLVYPSTTRRAHRYGPEEVREIFEQHGFAIATWTETKLPFMESPACNQGRSERVLSFVAVKSATTIEPDGPPSSDDAPIPRHPLLATYSAPHPFFAAVCAAIDGARSTSDIAAKIAAEQGMDLPSVLVATRAAVRDVLDAMRRSGA